MEDDPEYGRFRWERATVEVDEDGRLVLRVEMREPQDGVWAAALRKLIGDEVGQDTQRWRMLHVSSHEVAVTDLMTGEESWFRDMLEQGAAAADREVERRLEAAGELQHKVRKLAGFPPRRS